MSAGDAFQKDGRVGHWPPQREATASHLMAQAFHFKPWPFGLNSRIILFELMSRWVSRRQLSHCDLVGRDLQSM